MQYASLPVGYARSWAFLNNVQLSGVTVQDHIIDEYGDDKGGGVVATQKHQPSNVLMSIPHDLVLNQAAVENFARSDIYLREVLEAVGKPFLETPRRVIMIFLLLQLTYSSPTFEGQGVGVTTPWTDYVKTLPKNVPLPTRWNANEQESLSGTSAEAALEQKLHRLQTEFDHIKMSTKEVVWCQKTWWSIEDGLIGFDDWKVVDSIYRSRGLELPKGIGHSMLPVLDMTNHALEGENNARFEVDDEGNALLVVRNDGSIEAGSEVTITYGFGGACEMIFSYGFLDRETLIAKELFLSLNVPNDDPLKRIKAEFAGEAPGVRIFSDDLGQILWESPFVWWACVNQEDGLVFEILKQVDGSTELKAYWKGSDLKSDDLPKLLDEDHFRDVFRLRATVLVQDRVETQGRELSLSQERFDVIVEHGDCDPSVLDMTSRLRDLEMELLAASYQALEQEKAQLLVSETVRTYLKQQEDPDRTGGADEDFS